MRHVRRLRAPPPLPHAALRAAGACVPVFGCVGPACPPRTRLASPHTSVADKLLRLSRAAARATARADSELPPALRALLAAGALVVGAAEQPIAATLSASSRNPAAAAEDHLAASLDAAREFSAGDLRACADAYAAAAGRCGPPSDCSVLLAVLQGATEALAAVEHQAQSERGS